jgi:membrane protein
LTYRYGANLRVLRRLTYAGRVAWRAFWRFQDHHGPDRAAAISYYTLLSLIPLLIFMISLGVRVVGSFDEAYKGTLLLVRGVVIPLDQNALESLRDFVERASRFQWPGLLLLAWTSRRIFGSLFSALERVFGVPGRSFARHNLVSLAMVLVLGVILLFSMALTMAVATSRGLLLRFAPAGSAFEMVWETLIYDLTPAVISFLFFFVIYRVVPRRTVSTAHAAAGAVLATALWELAKTAFAWYLRNLARYAGVYGTLEGIIVLALWLEISASIILYCAEVVALVAAPERVQRRIAFEPDPAAENQASQPAALSR